MNLQFEDMFVPVPVMAILRGMGTERTINTSRVAWSLGVNSVEVPLQTPSDVTTLAELAALAAENGHIVGAGTILDRDGVAAAVDAGAQFTVSPGWDTDVARHSMDAGLLHLPGVGSATDIQQARRFGLRWVKAFPAAQLGPTWIAAMKSPFPDMSFVATGGITLNNASSFLSAGAAAVAIGSALEDERAVKLLHSIA